MTGLPHSREQLWNTQSIASAVFLPVCISVQALRSALKVTTYTFILQIIHPAFLTYSAVSSLRVEILPYFVYTW